jgi:L-asparaginase
MCARFARPFFLLTFLLSPWSVEAAQARPQPVGATEMPRVRLIATGGTISNKAGGRLTADELVGLIPDVGRWARAETEQFSNQASSQLTLDQWLALAKRINGVLNDDPGLAGLVITSGTDTLEELA